MTPDTRHLATGTLIPTGRYADQPFVIKTDDGAWLLTVTSNPNEEGEPGQRVISLRSTDHGKTWSDPVPLEKSTDLENSYSVLLKTPSGRIYCFYNHNSDDVRWIIADDPPYEGGKCYRVDSMGYFVFKYSDDHGRSWSEERYPIPVREFEIDRENPYGGDIRFFWNVGKAFSLNDNAYVPLCKVGRMGQGFFVRNEGVLLKSKNLFTEADPERIEWETLPDGDIGLRTPPGGGLVAGEQNYVVLSDGTIHVIYRTIDGHPCSAYSRDGGHTWTEPAYTRYHNGRLIKHPRAANFAWRCENGKYLYWFHNHGGQWYEDRNPAWLCGGIEVDTPDGKVIHWSQPEIGFYVDDPFVRMSYPDHIEADGKHYITETQKELARVHELNQTLLDGLWGQFEPTTTRVDAGCILELTVPIPDSIEMPQLPIFLERDNHRADYGRKDLRNGFSLEFWLTLNSLDSGQIIIDSRTSDDKGISLKTGENGTLDFILGDGHTENRWRSDAGMLSIGEEHHVVVIVDGGPKIILFVIDGLLCDGGEERQYGWGHFSPNLYHANNYINEIAAIKTWSDVVYETGEAHLNRIDGDISQLCIFDRALRVSEAINNFKFGRGYQEG